jgi:hypothetical protein
MLILLGANSDEDVTVLMHKGRPTRRLVFAPGLKDFPSLDAFF